MELTQAYIAENAGVSQAAVSQWGSKENLSPTIKKKLIFLYDEFRVNLDWLANGVGEPFDSKRLQEPSFAYAGGPGQYSSAEEAEIQDWAYVKKIVQENQEIKIFRVVGDSMAPTLHEGDFLFCFRHDKTRDEIRNTHIYIIETIHHGLLIKRMMKREDGYVTVYSDNRTASKSFRLHIERDILSLHRVRTRMTWQLGAPTTEADYFAALAERIEKLEKQLQ